jgi:hypothetical protein
MLLGRVIIIVVVLVFVAWLVGGLLRGRPERGSRRARRDR